MEKLNDLKNWMKPWLKQLVRFINRLESRLEKQARERQRAQAKQGRFGASMGQDFPAVPETSFSDRLGPYSPNLAVRTRFAGYRDRDEV